MALVLVASPALLVGVHLASAQGRNELVHPEALNRAIEEQHATIRAAPMNPEGYQDLGNLLALRGDQKTAEEAYRHAIELDPSSAASHYDLALLLGGDRPREAIELLQKSLELDPQSAWAHYTLGTLQQGRGNRRAAIRSFATAFALNPELALADINPQVIANPDATAALLRARHRAPISSAPRDYADPGRIALLMTELVESEGQTEMPSTVSDPESGAGPTGTATESTTGSQVDSSREPSQPTPRALAEPPDSPQSRQALPTAGAGSPAEASAEGAPGQRRSLSSDDLRSQPDINQSTPPAGAAPGGRTDPNRPGSRARFRPGSRSSARLQLELDSATNPANSVGRVAIAIAAGGGSR